MGPPSFWRAVARDIRHALDGPLYTTPSERSPWRIARTLLAPEFEIVFRYRIYNAHYRRGYTKVPPVLYIIARRHTRCDLAMQATIGAGLRIAHASDIIVGSGSVIGQDCELFNGVTLGNKTSSTPTSTFPGSATASSSAQAQSCSARSTSPTTPVWALEAWYSTRSKQAKVVAGVPAQPLKPKSR